MSRTAARSSRTDSPRNPWRPVALILLGLATAVSVWLAVVSTQAGPVPGCNTGDCGAVLTSRWAKLFGVPVGVFGAAAYAILALLGARRLPDTARGARTVGAILVLLIPAAALWFASIQLFVLKAFCPWCCATHALATLGAIFMALAWRADRPVAGSRASRKTSGGGSDSVWRPAFVWAVVAFAGFLIAQVMSPVPVERHIVTGTMEGPNSSTGPQVAATSTPAPTASDGTGEQGAAVPSADRRIRVHQGRFELDPHDLPVIGSADAQHLVVMIADYTCHYCRAAHRLLEEVRASFAPSQLGILMLPSQHAGDSIEIQRLMLAVWKINPAVWATVADDLYGERLALKGPAVREVLSRQVGADRLNASLAANADWINRTFQLTKEITAANRLVAKSGNIPQFIIGQEVVVGAPTEASEFYDLFARHLGLVREHFPELQLAHSELNLGRVFAGTQRPVIFPFSNPGQATVEVSRIATPSGGRVLKGLRVPVAPGQTSAVEFTVAVPRDAGPFEQIATLYSNARTSSIPVRVTGEAWKPLSITPSILDFGRLDPSETSTQGVVRVELEQEARITAARSQNPGFVANLHEVTPGRVYDVTVATTPSLAVGTQQAAILLELKSPVPEGWPQSVAFAVRAVVDRAVTVVPPRILLPSTALADDRHHQVLVRCTDGTPGFEVRSAVLEGGPAFLQPQIRRGGSNEFIVQMTLPAGWTVPAAPSLARLIIGTSHPRFGSLEVPLVPQGQ